MKKIYDKSFIRYVSDIEQLAGQKKGSIYQNMQINFLVFKSEIKDQTVVLF